MSQVQAPTPSHLHTPTRALPPIPHGYAADLEHGFDSDRARVKAVRGEVKKHEATLAKLASRNASPSNSTEVTREVERLRRELDNMESHLVPWHHDEQLLSPKSLLCTPLFGVARSGVRQPHVELKIPHSSIVELTYQGPELRQSDGLVFMALLHLARDFKPGRRVFFSPQALIESFGHQYGGSERQQLRQTIMRLQGSFLQGPDFRVQLVGYFCFPKHGDWSVGLDAKVMQLFEGVQPVWMQRRLRTELPPGLATWLLGYVRSQGILNPTSLTLLQKRCGSQAKPKNFAASLREALTILEHNQVVKPDWRVVDGKVTWKKGENG